MSMINESSVPFEQLDREVVSLFLADTPAKIHELRLAYEAGNTESVRKLAHYLKGSAMYINARQMSTVCAEVQSLASAGGGAALRDALAKLEQEYARLSSRLQQHQE